jgi:hypothetical protein
MNVRIPSVAAPNNGMQRSADTTAFIFGEGAARPLMPGVMRLAAIMLP